MKFAVMGEFVDFLIGETKMFNGKYVAGKHLSE